MTVHQGRPHAALRAEMPLIDSYVDRLIVPGEVQIFESQYCFLLKHQYAMVHDLVPRSEVINHWCLLWSSFGPPTAVSLGTENLPPTEATLYPT